MLDEEERGGAAWAVFWVDIAVVACALVEEELPALFAFVVGVAVAEEGWFVCYEGG